MISLVALFDGRSFYVESVNQISINLLDKFLQDIFLPHVESGLLTLVGATTENPSFTLNSALLSRSVWFSYYLL